MEHDFYLRGLKRALKARRLTYDELARKLRMTESGVKKMLNAKDLSFRRLAKICNVLGVLPGELLSSFESSSIPRVEQSREQEAALLKDRKLLALYWLTVVEDRRPAEVSSSLKIGDAELKMAFQKLRRLGLLSAKRGGLESPHGRKFRWPDDSELARVLNREGSQLTLKRALESGRRDPADHRFVALRLSEIQVQELRRRLGEVFDDAARNSERELLNAEGSERLSVTATFALSERGLFE